ncbi:4334_t:CDS:2, partial [Dentiscutata heterogama]
MSSLFVAFCLAKNVTGNDSYITGTVLYRINNNTNQFREITFKDHTSCESIISECKDSLNYEILPHDYSFSQFKNITNLPRSLYLQEGARVMFLNSKLFDNGICNCTIGIMTKLIDNDNIKVTFPTYKG